MSYYLRTLDVGAAEMDNVRCANPFFPSPAILRLENADIDLVPIFTLQSTETIINHRQPQVRISQIVSVFYQL